MAPSGRNTPGAGGGVGGAYKPVIRPVKAPHASTPHHTTATATAKPPSWLNTSALTPAQMDAQATTEANQSIAPQVSGLQGQQQTYDAQQKAYQAAMTGFYQALAPYMAGIQGHVSDAYNSAAQTMGDIGHGYAGALGTAAANDNAETNAALARAGQAPLAAPGTGLTDAFAATHGGIEGSSFAQEGAAKAADAANKPAVWAAQGRDSMTEAINKAVAGDQQYADQIKQIYATVPGLRDTILKQIQSAEIDKAKLRDTEANTSFSQAAKKVSLQQGQTRLQQADARLGLQQQMDAFNQKYKLAGLQLSGERLTMSAQRFARQTLQQDRQYAVELTHLGIAKKSLQLRAIAQEYKLQNGGFTPTQTNRFKTDAAYVITQMKEASQLASSGAKYTSGPNKGQPWQAPTFQEAMAQMLKRHVPVSMATKAIHAYDPTLAGTPIDAGIVGNYNKMTGVGQKPVPFDAVNFASDYLGVPYKWGGTSNKGLDCSGFTQAVYKRLGINIGRTTYTQVKRGKAVNLNQLQPGDLVFTEPGKNGPNHVGMYIGNGIVQESPHTGDVNKRISLSSFLSGGFVAARRYLGG